MTEPDNSRPPMQYDLSVCAACGKPATAWQDDYNRNAVGWCGGATCQGTINGTGSVDVDEVASYVDVTFAARGWLRYHEDTLFYDTHGRDLDYDKHPYEVLLKDGSRRVCWPNAGVFVCLKDGKTRIEFNQVQAVRPGPYPWDEE